MRLTCPACHAEASLETLLAREADARALAGFINRHIAAGTLLVQYIGLFRPAKRRLSLARTVALFDELAPDIERGAVTRKGRDWAAPLPVWVAAIEQMLATRDKGGLTLPLSSHGYLYEVIVGLADKTEAQAERGVEVQRRNEGHAGAGAVALGMTMDLAQVMAAVAPGATATPVANPAPYDMAKGPSRAARELQAHIAAARASRTASTASAAGTSIPAESAQSADAPQEPKP